MRGGHVRDDGGDGGAERPDETLRRGARVREGGRGDDHRRDDSHQSRDAREAYAEAMNRHRPRLGWCFKGMCCYKTRVPILQVCNLYFNSLIKQY